MRAARRAGMRAHGFIRACAVVAVCGAMWPAATHAQDYPSRPITVVVPFSAGGSFDVVARIIAARMQEIAGQPVVVENVGGGGGTTGVKRVIAAEPDGYTVLFGTIGTHAYNQWIYKKRRYDAVADFTPVTLFSEQPMVLVARKALPVEALPDFAALLKSKGDKLQFGSAGVGSTTHLGCALLNSRIGVTVTHVAYRGGGPAMNDLLGGQIDYFCGNLGGYVPHILAKEVKAIALLAKERSPLMPDLKSAHEQGLTDLNVVTWTALFLPKGAPRPVVDRLLAITQEAMESPDTRKRMLAIGVTGVAPERRSPEYLAAFVVEEIGRWEEPIKSGGLQVE
jgi:tripartite-type tricarboxylate transporter receptor subunit TctC